MQGKGLVVSGICERFIEEFVGDARYVQIRIHADRQTDGRTDRRGAARVP